MRLKNELISFTHTLALKQLRGFGGRNLKLNDMKLNTEYKPCDCADLADVKAGINRLFDICNDLSKPIVKRRLGAYQRVVNKLKIDFNCFTYYLEL